MPLLRVLAHLLQEEHVCVRGVHELGLRLDHRLSADVVQDVPDLVDCVGGIRKPVMKASKSITLTFKFSARLRLMLLRKICRGEIVCLSGEIFTLRFG